MTAATAAPLRASPLLGEVEIVRRTGLGATARYSVTDDETVLAGHYPGFPIFPGVCLVECVHAGALATLPGQDPALGLRGIRSVRFLSPVFPAEEVTVELEWTPSPGGWECAARVSTPRGDAARVKLSYGHGGEGIDADPADILRRLPHRGAMLLVDRVLEAVPGERLTAVKAVSRNESWYERLGPEEPAEGFGYPSTLLLESWCQAAGLLATWTEPNPDVCEGAVMLFGGVADVGYGRAVLPGSVLEHRVALVRRVGETAIFEGESTVDGAPVLTVGRLTMTFRPAAELHPAWQEKAHD